MTQYVIRRLLQTLLVIFGVSIISFGIIFLSGDPTYLMLGEVRGMSDEQIAEFRSRMGFDRPWIVQYFDYMGNAVQGDLGKSFYHGIPNVELIAEHMPATIQLGVAAWVISLVVGIPTGVLAATYRGRLIDNLSMIAALAGQAMPIFWLGLMLMLIFAVKLKWFPVSGRGSVKHLVLPAVTLSSFAMAQNARMVRSSMLEVLGQDYMRTARAKGLSNLGVLYRHALKNAMIPVVTLVGVRFGQLLSGTIIIESVFGWPGMGRLLVYGIWTRDYPMVQACVLMLAGIFVFINLVVDILYGLLDPRIRYA